MQRFTRTTCLRCTPLMLTRKSERVDDLPTPFSGTASFVQKFAKFQRISTLVTAGDKMLAVVNDLSDLQISVAEINEIHHAPLATSEISDRKRGGVYILRPPYLVRIQIDKPWKVLQMNCVCVCGVLFNDLK
jgi:hypothetical protein